MRKNYQTVRNIQHVITPDISDDYSIFDHKIMSPEGGHNIPIRVFLPSEEIKPGVLVFFHGGGWVIGDIETYTPTCVHMAETTRQIVYSVDYRLAPEYPFPAGLNDCYYATKHLMYHYEKVAPQLAGDFTLIGDSAGANLAAAVSLRLRDNGEKLADRQILIYPALYWDHDEDTSIFDSVRTNGKDYGLTSKQIQEYMELYVPDLELRKTQDVAPLMTKDYSDQPDTLILSAEYDPLRDEAETYSFLLEKSGNKTMQRRILKAPHGFLNYPDVTGAIEESYRIINSFLYNQPLEDNEKPEAEITETTELETKTAKLKAKSDKLNNAEPDTLRKKLKGILSNSEKSRELNLDEINQIKKYVSMLEDNA